MAKKHASNIIYSIQQPGRAPAAARTRGTRGTGDTRRPPRDAWHVPYVGARPAAALAGYACTSLHQSPVVLVTW